MSLHTAEQLAFLRQSEIRNMSIECAKVSGINLAQGVCDTEVPEPVRLGGAQAMADGFNIYTRYDGLPALREAIARKVQRDSGMVVDPEKEVVVTSGTTGAFFATCMTLFDPGDAVVLFEPYYGYHLDTLRALSLGPSFVPLELPNWSFDVAALRAAIGPKTRAIVLNTPGNPSGKVFSRAELELVAQVAREFDLFVITDEIYEYFVYDNREHISFATLPGMRQRTITIAGFSKTFSITGWRVGYFLATAELCHKIGHAHDLVYVCAPAPLQIGVARGLDELEPSFYEDLKREYTRKREKLCSALEHAGISPHVPSGAYYVLADSRRIPGSSAKERALSLLGRAGVAAVPGSAFFQGGRGDDLLRFSYAKREAELDEACRRLDSFRP
ncbi:MAG TPA: aminotransferase class I/II-fold pyridoxal phosphate-dependent enzyme [Polyangiaceae bacterium]|jgi:aminotransferase|nr:aminotransferase class I/II-fold pyridoxal phosphate-dependent enzyme [Polyangiaceae bacterium]